MYIHETVLNIREQISLRKYFLDLYRINLCVIYIPRNSQILLYELFVGTFNSYDRCRSA